MAFRWRPRPKPKPRPVKTKKPTDFNIRESGTSLGELVPTQPLLDIPSPKTTDLPVPVSKTGLADTPEGKEAVKKILTGPEMTRRTFDTGLIQLILQAILPTPKLSLTKAPVPVPKAKTTPLNIEWKDIRPQLQEMLWSKFFGSDDDALEFQENLDEESYINYAEQGGNPYRDLGTEDYDNYLDTERDLVQHELINNIMRWKLRENPERIQKLINAWDIAEDIRTAPQRLKWNKKSLSSQSPEYKKKRKELVDKAEKAEKAQKRIVNFLMSGFEKYSNKEKYNEEWFKKTAKNLERIPNSPPPFKTSYEMFIHNADADARVDQLPDNPSASEIKQTTLWGDIDYTGTHAPDEHTVTGWRSDVSVPDKPRPKKWVEEDKKWLGRGSSSVEFSEPDPVTTPVYSRRLQETMSRGGSKSPLDQPVTRRIIDDKYETAVSKLNRTLYDMHKSKINFVKDAHERIDKAWYPEEQLPAIVSGGVLEDWGVFKKGERTILKPQETVEDVVKKITEVQTTPDPVTGTIDEKISKLQEETKYQDEQAQKAKTTGDVKDKFLSRRQLLFPRNKNTGGLVGLY